MTRAQVGDLRLTCSEARARSGESTQLSRATPGRVAPSQLSLGRMVACDLGSVLWAGARVTWILWFWTFRPGPSEDAEQRKSHQGGGFEGDCDARGTASSQDHFLRGRPL